MIKVAHICKIGDKWMAIAEKKLEILKVWYSVFCTIIDDFDATKTESELQKLQKLRRRLKDESPELELQIKQMKN